MRRQPARPRLVSCITAALACTSAPVERVQRAVLDAGASAGSAAVPLFNGIDFSGWDRYLGKPSAAEPALGIDNDPRGVY